MNVVRTRLRVDTDIVDIVLGKGVTFEDSGVPEAKIAAASAVFIRRNSH